MRTMENQYSDKHILRLQLGKTLSNFRSICEPNSFQTHNHLAHKQTLNHLAKLVKYSSQYFIYFSSPKTMD